MYSAMHYCQWEYPVLAVSMYCAIECHVYTHGSVHSRVYVECLHYCQQAVFGVCCITPLCMRSKGYVIGLPVVSVLDIRKRRGASRSQQPHGMNKHKNRSLHVPK